MAKRLELDWPHKGEHALQNPATGKWEFCGDAPLPPRPLIEIQSYGDEQGKEFDLDRSNLLIKGENLHALTSLLPYYADQIRLIYIDPPFNTGAEFEAYDDNFQHSVWLSMMDERLDLLWQLLSDDGALFVEIDDNEQAYLKALLDSRFGRRHFVGTISIKRSAPTGHKAINPGFVNVTEYIHVYAKNKPLWRYNPLSVPRGSYDTAYNELIKNPDEPFEDWQFTPLSTACAQALGFQSATEARKVMGSSAFKERTHEFALENCDRVTRLAIPEYKGVSKAAQKMIDLSKSDHSKVFHLPREEYQDMYFWKGQRILFLSHKTEETEQGPELVEPLTNFWADISWQGIAREGGAVLRKGKKPERLLRRIIRLATDIDGNDIVLDCFGGTGTAAAVAHKMGCRWILIEFDSTLVEEQALPRLSRVVSGEDDAGVTKVQLWKGGGGFRFLEVGAPLLQDDPETHLTIINPQYSNGPLVRAVCAVEGFVLTGDQLLHGRNGTHFAHVTEEFVDEYSARELKKRLGDGEMLTIYAAKGVKRSMALPQGVVVKRIATDLLKRYTS